MVDGTAWVRQRRQAIAPTHSTMTGMLMHDTALHLGRLAIEIYGPEGAGSILDIGSADINGTLRQFAKPPVRYIGVDLDKGPGVDIVIEPGVPLPFGDGEFDLVVATSVLEHDPVFWQTFLEMCRLAAPGGHVYFNSPSNGVVHRYPEDNWRFYPDCGKALARWARSQGHDVELVESFTARREADIWNDFVAVFRKHPAGPHVPNRALHAEVNCENIILGDEGTLQQPAFETEDARLMKAAQEAAAVAARERDDARVDLASTKGSHADAVRRIALLETQVQDARTERVRLETERVRLEGEQARLEIDAQTALAERARLAAECEALRAAMEAATRKEEAITSELSRVSALHKDDLRKLSESEKWNFALARERAALERQVDALDRKLARTQREATGLRAAMQDAKGEKKVITQTLALAEKDRNRLEGECAAIQAKLDQITRRLEEREEEMRQLSEDFELLQIRLQERNREVSALSRRVASDDRKAQEVEAEREWLAAVGTALFDAGPWWWWLIGPRLRTELIERRLRRRGLFDADAYLARYPDVRSSGMSAVVHYLRHGRLESRIRD